ncbi:MAG: hypothetical protein Q9165_002316 [Trypethelium subeluteriae]
MVSNNRIEKVAVVGAGGNVGKFITEALVKAGKFKVTAITRADSSSQLPPHVETKKVDYNDQSSLVSALQGQDALVITLGVMALDAEPKLVDAAAAAGVPWILPNVWSPDMDNESLSKETLVGDKIQATKQHILKLGKSNFISVSTGFWYEYSLAIPAAYGFDFKDKTVTLFDEGTTKIQTSTWPQVGRAVASILSLKIAPDGASDNSPNLEQYKNKYIYTNSFTISQRDILDSVLRVTKTQESDWKIEKEPSHQRYAAGMQALQTGDPTAFAKILYSRVFFPDGSGNIEDTKGLANGLLNLPKENLDEYTEVAIERSKKPAW